MQHNNGIEPTYPTADVSSSSFESVMVIIETCLVVSRLQYAKDIVCQSEYQEGFSYCDIKLKEQINE